ncbi:MAG: hypothetical protein V7636_2913 [Actinomycetota bacterium]
MRETIRKAMASWRDLGTTPYGLRPIVLMSLIALFQVLDDQAFAFALPDIIREFHISFTAISSIIAMVGFFAVVLGVWLGYLSDRVRRLPLFLGGTTLSGVMAMIAATAHSNLSLGVPRVVNTGTEKASEAPQFSLIADYYPPDARGRAYGLQGMAGALGGVLGPVVAAALITMVGLRWTFVLVGLPIFALGLIGFVLLREPVRGYFERKHEGATDETANREDDPPSFAEAWRTVWSVRTLRRYFIGAVILGLGLTPFFSLYQLFLSEQYGLTTGMRGVVSAVFILGGLAGTFIGAAAIDVLARERPERAMSLFALFGTIASLGMLVLAFGPPLGVVVFGITFFFFGVSLTGPAQAAIISQVTPPNVRGVGVQVVSLSALPAIGFGVPIFGQLVAHQGWGMAIGISVPLLILGSLVIGSAGGTFDLDRRSAFAASLAAEEWRAAKESGAAKLLVCRDVTVHYDNVQVLFGVDLDIEQGEIVALLGTNGAGKSTLLRAISGTHEASGGAIVFDGRDITHMPPHEVAHRGVVSMPGGRGVFPALTVRENLQLARGMVPDADDFEQRLAEVFDIFPILRTRAGASAGALSGGEQQQLSLAQAFLANPTLLMIDELSLGLSPVVTGELIEKVREIHARGTTVIVVEQSVNVALELADRAVFMEKGAVRFSGPTTALLARPDILRAVYVKGTGGNAAAASDTRRIERLREAPIALEVEGVEKRYGGVTALDGVSFSVSTGMVLGILGPNGSGKTTLFDVISGFQPADAGTVRMEGIDITALSATSRAEGGLIRRFQDARLFPSLTVYETVLLALDQQLTGKSTLANALALPGTRRGERRLARRADELIELLGLDAYRDKFVKELSTGLRRITDLACTLARQPRVLLLDEPSSGIAQSEAEGLAPLLRRIQHETGATMLIIEHDVPLLTRVSDELLVMATGKVLVRGAADVVLDDERVVEAYLGTSEAAVNRSGSRT